MREKFVSVATVSADVPSAYGSLLCWGKNAVGYQTVPCIHTFSPAGMSFDLSIKVTYNIYFSV